MKKGSVSLGRIEKKKGFGGADPFYFD